MTVLRIILPLVLLIPAACQNQQAKRSYKADQTEYDRAASCYVAWSFVNSLVGSVADQGANGPEIKAELNRQSEAQFRAGDKIGKSRADVIAEQLNLMSTEDYESIENRQRRLDEAEKCKTPDYKG